LTLGPRVSLDIDGAEALVTEAEHRGASNQPALAVTAANSALEILSSGSVLEDEPGVDWAVDVSRQVERALRRARVAAWRAAMDLDDHRAALGHARAAIDADALDEEAHRAVILSYHRLGEQGEALRAYERLRTVLLEELGANPGSETEALFAAVLRGEEVDDARAASTSTRSEDGDFVGRDRELAELLELWTRATSGVSLCALIVGDGGIGKTRLAAELADDVCTTGATVLRARCYEAEQSLFLQPIIELIREAIATLTPDVVRRAAGDRVRWLTTLVPELAAIADAEPSAAVTGEIERRHTFEAVAQLLTGLARSRPLLVVLDDLHEAGASTVELLHFALRWDARAPLLVVATVRSDEAESVNEHLPSGATTVAVSGLTEEAIRSLAERAGLADRADAIASMTRGHTLFVVEALRALADARSSGEASSGHIDVPPSLRDAVTGRVRRCGPEVEEVLRAAVVVGSAFDVTLLGELVGISPEAVIQRTEPARRAGIVIEAGDGYEFSNDLIREILYDTTPKPLRVVRHRRLVALLDDQPEAAARHAAAAGDARLAVTHWCAAAERAANAFANREADQLLTAALEAATSLEDERTTATILLARGRSRLALGQYTAASDDLLQAEQLGHFVGADELETTALTERAWAAFHARDIVRAKALAEEAIGRAGAGPRASILVGRVRNARGDLHGSITLLRQVAEDADVAAQRAHALSCLGTALAHSDRYDEAMPVLDAAAIACRRTGVLRGMLNAEMFGAIVLANLGRFGPALSWAEQALTDADRFDAAYYHPRALNSLALIWRELGELSRAHDLAEEALATSSTSDGELEGEPAANALLALAESALLAGDDAGAVDRLDEIQPLLSDRVGFAWRIELRRLEIYARTEPARAEELLISAREFGAAKYEALGLSYLGRSEEALATAQLTGSGWLVARVAPEPIAREQAERLAADLPADLRSGFVERGLLLRRLRER
jgi:DNA-binding SARP family transcriptional activator